MTEGKANRLLYEKSLYLRKHAYNPVDWWPWCPEARTLAQELDRPIMLSIGYSSCHWCTVMEHEAFSDQPIADYLNQHFIAIKVDREERPDVDSIYMQALQMMTEQGGWPLNIFLTPQDLVPFYGGTYFPIEPRYGRPGFLKVLEFLSNYYQTNRDDLTQRQTRLMDMLGAAGRLGAGQQIQETWIRKGVVALKEIVPRQGQGPNFPMIPYVACLLQASRFNWGELQTDLEDRCLKRGLDLALGGIFDHVGGGFHRYTVDGTWTVPHFEKMLYDNGQILTLLADLWCQGHRQPAFERACRLTIDWLDREMTAPEGYFYSSQDADSEGVEGKFYVWSYTELQDLVADALPLLTEAFAVSPAGNFEEGGHRSIVLQRKKPGHLDPVVEQALGELFKIRHQRVPPVTDTKLILAWNALMISGLVHVYRAFGEPSYLSRAQRCAQFLIQNQGTVDQLYRVNYEGVRAVAAQAEDYALGIRALLDLFSATQDPQWLTTAQHWQTLMDQALWDTTSGAYFSAPVASKGELILREKDFQDNATPAANGVAAHNLLRLFALTDEGHYLKRAEQTILAFAQILERSPRACPTLLSAVDHYWNLTLVQTFPDGSSPPIRARLLAQYHPTVTLKEILRPDDTESALALVCKGTTCLPPTGSEVDLWDQIGAVTGRVG